MQKNVVSLRVSSDFLSFGSCITSASRWILQQLALDGTDLRAYLFAIDESITLHDLSMNCRNAEELLGRNHKCNFLDKQEYWGKNQDSVFTKVQSNYHSNIATVSLGLIKQSGLIILTDYGTYNSWDAIVWHAPIGVATSWIITYPTYISWVTANKFS